MPSKEKKPQDELFDLIFSSKGPLSLVLDDFEERDGQREMAEQILEAYTKDQIALIEAGTGTGKSLAYLVPAIFWALKSKEKTVISTNTISLQEQLINKDIPFLLNALDLDLNAVLVKGMNNYLCLRKLDDLREQLNLFSDEQEREIEAVERWAQHSPGGSRSEINFPLSHSTWEKVGAEADACNHVHCPSYKKCFFFKARRKAGEAQILVVNHHLLLADLISKQAKDIKNEKSILPPYNRLILDEAHHLEEIAFDALSKRMDNIALTKLLGKVFSDLNPQKSKLGALKQTLDNFYADGSQPSILSLTQRLEIDLPAKKREISEINVKIFDKLERFCAALSGEQNYRLKKPLIDHPDWKGEIKSDFLALSSALSSFAQSILSLCLDLEALKDPRMQEKMQSDLVEVRAAVSRLEEFAANLENFFSQEEKIHCVRWIERTGFLERPHLALVEANLDVSAYLKEHLLEPISTVAMCSATLTVGENFEYIKQRLGIPCGSSVREVTEKVYDSPFDYQNQSLLLIPTDIPDPLDKEFISAASKKIFGAIAASTGNAFVLFTSYDMLRACHAEVLTLAERTDFTFLKQGDASRQTLIERFKSTDKSILFGTDSFWEGVDVAGDALRCVILVKLPFKVPNHPKAQAHSEFLLKMGKDPFRDHSLPQAALKFKQGFGRLIRTKNDKGCVVCLDRRLITKSYGKTFLNSLPKCRVIADDSEKIFAAMKKFYGA
jgi:ATP-dependent DNA helicase DinG